MGKANGDAVKGSGEVGKGTKRKRTSAPEPPPVSSAPAPAPRAAASPNATAVVPPQTPGVAVETGGVGVVAPEGLVSFPL